MQTNALATITSTSGPTNVTVGGNTNLVGGAITSSGGATNLTTGTLTASNLNDSKTSSSSSFGVTIGANPGLSFSEANATRLGLTFSVVGDGAITLTAPGADTSVLATLKRDQSGRQIVTVDDHSGFSIDISKSDFDALAKVATTAGNFLSALTDPPPAEVAAGGSGAVKTWQTYVATGNTAANDAEAVVQAAKTKEALADAGAIYDGAPPTQVTQAIGLGLTVVLPGDQPTLSPPGALVPDLNGYEPAPTVVTVAASDAKGGVINAAADATPPGALVCGTAIAACDGNDKVDLVYTPGLDPPAGVQTVASVTPTQVGGAALGFGGVALMTGEGTAVACAGSGGVACPVAAAGAGLFLLGAGAYYTIPDGTGAWASNQLTNAWNTASAAIAAMTGSGGDVGSVPGGRNHDPSNPDQTLDQGSTPGGPSGPTGGGPNLDPSTAIPLLAALQTVAQNGGIELTAKKADQTVKLLSDLFPDGGWQGQLDRLLNLGNDPSRGLLPNEISSGVRLERQLGRTLQRSSDLAYEYIDSSGKTYDAVGGNIPNSKFNLLDFTSSIETHLMKQGLDRTVVDLNGLSSENATAVMNLLNTLTASQRTKIIVIR